MQSQTPYTTQKTRLNLSATKTSQELLRPESTQEAQATKYPEHLRDVNAIKYNEALRICIQQEFAQRLQRNPRYSLRAFATSLELNAGHLSRILSSKRNISKKLSKKILSKIRLSPNVLEKLSSHQELSQAEPHERGWSEGSNAERSNDGKATKYPEHLRPKHVRDVYATRSNVNATKYPEHLRDVNATKYNITSTESPFKNLTLEYFRVVSDWYHFAILELTRTNSFKNKHSWIAKRLGLTHAQVNLAIQRLLDLEMLIKDKKGNYKNVAGNITTKGDCFSVSAYRNFQKQVLELASQALEEIPIGKRFQSSMTLSINTQDIPEVVNKINQFEENLLKFVERTTERNEVYQTSISFFPLTKISRESHIKSSRTGGRNAN